MKLKRSAGRRSFERQWLINVKSARCNYCKETIYISDDESEVQILARIDKHVAKCPQATFSFDADTDEGEKKLRGLLAVIDEEARKK
jgi:hypothetical protein